MENLTNFSKLKNKDSLGFALPSRIHSFRRTHQKINGRAKIKTIPIAADIIKVIGIVEQLVKYSFNCSFCFLVIIKSPYQFF